MRKILIKIIPILFFFTVVFTSCQQENEVQMNWNQTYCAEPWGNVNNSDFDALEMDIDDYLTEQEIEVLDIKIDDDWSNPEECLACTCLSGVRIEVWVNEEDVDKMNEIGFYQE